MAKEATSHDPSEVSPAWMAHPMYAATIHKAIGAKDVAKMKEVAEQAKAWLAGSGDVGAALEILKSEIAKREAKGA